MSAEIAAKFANKIITDFLDSYDNTPSMQSIIPYIALLREWKYNYDCRLFWQEKRRHRRKEDVEGEVGEDGEKEVRKVRKMGEKVKPRGAVEWQDEFDYDDECDHDERDDEE